MPMVRIELYPGRTREQKARAAREITDAIHRTLGAPPEATDIIFVEVEKAHWASAGKLADES
ncbi:MAG: tautomerase family protein [Alphaproteobacteria bacterium]|nr:tautomerase family protein [Alphaproteobacteria bacterium]